MLHPLPQTQIAAQAPRKGGVRPMAAADVPAVARLFLKVFRGADRPAGADLENYLRALTLGSPCYSETAATQVYEHQDGSIRSALLAVPMRFIACGHVLPGRLLGVFMTDGNKEAAGAAKLILALRPRRADFSFCDSASPTSASHLVAIGGKPIPVQNLEWSRSFRPLGALAGRFAERVLRGRDPGLARLVRPVDALLRRLRGERDAEETAGVKVMEMPVPAFLEHAPRLIAHYAVRPLWSEDELSWLVSLAAQNTRLGSFTIRAVEDHAGKVIGCFVYYAAPGRTAIHRNPGGSRGGVGRMACTGGPCGRGWVLQRGSPGGPSGSGAISAPRQRGHHMRCRSRTFHRVPHCEHTWITGPC